MLENRRDLLSILLLGIALVACAAGPAEDGRADAEDEDASYAEAMSREHAGEVPTPTAAAERSIAPVEAGTVVYAEIDGAAVEGFLARPEVAAAARPGVLLIHEWWGLNDNVRDVARQLAGEGYVALAVDLYGGESAADSAGARALMEAAMAEPGELVENLRQARGYLADTAGADRIGVLGWCFGGGWALQAGLELGDALDAVVMYYGRPVTERGELAALTAPLLGLFGGADQGIPVAAVREMETTLRDLGKEATIHVYEGAGHAFANPSGERYAPGPAEDAWEKTLRFLATHLGGGPPGLEPAETVTPREAGPAGGDP